MANYTEDERRHMLVPGRRYSIRLEDCCIEGQLEGVFLGREIDEEEGMVDYYRFDFGTLGPDWGKWDTAESRGSHKRAKTKLCPFCAYDETRIESWTVYEGLPGEHPEYAVMCLNCGAFGPNDLGISGAEKMWNLRREPKENDA